MNKKIIGAVAVVILVAGGSFWEGMTYAKSHAPARQGFSGQAGGAGFAGRTGMRGAGGGFSTGQIISADAGSITVKLASGSTQIILISGSTQIMKSVAGGVKDLSAGIDVIVNGSANTDGSLTATSVQIRPATTTQAR